MNVTYFYYEPKGLLTGLFEFIFGLSLVGYSILIRNNLALWAIGVHFTLYGISDLLPEERKLWASHLRAISLGILVGIVLTWFIVPIWF